MIYPGPATPSSTIIVSHCNASGVCTKQDNVEHQHMFVIHVMTGADQGVEIISNAYMLSVVCTTVVQSSSVMGSSNSRAVAIKCL